MISSNYKTILAVANRKKNYEEKSNSHTINIVFTSDINLETLFHDLEINDETTMIVLGNMSRSRRDVSFESVLQRMNKTDLLEIMWKRIHIKVSSKMMVLLHTNLNPTDITLALPPYRKIFIKNFKKTIQVSLTKKWSRYIFAHLISTHPTLRYNMAYLETHNPCSGRKKEIVYLCMDNANARIVLTIKEKNTNVISIKFSDDYSVHIKSYRYDYVNSAIEYMRRVLVMYEDSFDEINSIYQIESNVDVFEDMNSIKYLKSIYPDFFVSGYSRECPNLPLISTKDDPTAIEYPIGSGRYFSAPAGSYVSIKKNRLSNKNVYPYLVNCYPTDHRSRSKSQYMKYYCPDSYRQSVAGISPKEPVPTNLLIEGIERHTDIPSTIYDILVFIFGAPAHTDYKFQLCRQSFWCDTDIKFRKNDHRLYRLYEYMFETNLFMLQIHSNHLAHVILPAHRNDYIWNPKYMRSVLLVQEVQGAYGMRDNVYSLISHGGKFIFDNTHILCKSVIETKLRYTVRGVKHKKARQYIDENGKSLPYCEPSENELYEEVLSSEMLKHIVNAYELGTINKTQFKHFTNYKTRIIERYFENKK
jgi:hypothetical protein